MAALIVFGALTAQRSMLWGAGGDERAHFSYVQYLAEQHRLPLLTSDYVSTQVEALTDGFYPQSSPRDVHRVGLRGRSYEAFQPPLYYLTAVPVFNLSSNYDQKVRLLRFYDLALLLVSVALCGALARDVFGAAWPGPLALALTVLLWPGVLAGAVAVSNAALELPLVIAFMWALWRGATRQRPGALLAAGALLGLCLLTRVTLVFLAPLLPAVMVYAAWRARRLGVVIAGLVALALPLALLSPWLAFNERHFHALTANQLAENQQRHVVNQNGTRFTLATVASGDGAMLNALLPEEWQFESRRPGFTAIADGLTGILLAAAIFGLVMRRRRSRRAVLLLAAPLVLWLLTMDIGTLVAQWNLLHPRYGYAALVALALFAATATDAVPRLRERFTLGLATATSGLLVGVWVAMAATYYY